MLRHALAGVTEGRLERGVPVEIMGLMIGRPEANGIVVTDVFPLPVKGIEYQVSATQDVDIFMTRLQDALEEKRLDRFVGWYHSHPFDVESWSHCHLSSTDVATQAMWQFGSPFWTAIVIDPLRSLMKQQLELGVYRCYPPAYTPPDTQAPDFSVITDRVQHLRRWGVSASRYYELKQSFFCSSASMQVVNTLNRTSLWMRVIKDTAYAHRHNVLALVNQVQTHLKEREKESAESKSRKQVQVQSLREAISRMPGLTPAQTVLLLDEKKEHTVDDVVCEHNCCVTSSLFKAMALSVARADAEVVRQMEQHLATLHIQ